MTNPQTKASPLSTSLFIRSLNLTKLKIEVVTVICNSYIPVSSLLKLGFQIKPLPVIPVYGIYPSCYTPDKLNRHSFSTSVFVWVILCSLNPIAFLNYQAINFLLPNPDQFTYIMEVSHIEPIPSPTRTIPAQPFLLHALGVESSGYISSR